MQTEVGSVCLKVRDTKNKKGPKVKLNANSLLSHVITNCLIRCEGTVPVCVISNSSCLYKAIHLSLITRLYNQIPR